MSVSRFDPAEACDFFVTLKGGSRMFLVVTWERADEIMKWWQSYVEDDEGPRFYIWENSAGLRDCQFDMGQVASMEAFDPTSRLIRESDERERADLVKQQVAMQRLALAGMQESAGKGNAAKDEVIAEIRKIKGEETPS